MINFTRSNFFYDPFPHCVLEEFLDNSIYEEICKEYPDIEILDRMSVNKIQKLYFFMLDKEKPPHSTKK